MTKAEWLVCEDAERMLVVLGHELQHSIRRLPAYAATFAESGRVRALLTPHLRITFDALVRWVQEDGLHPARTALAPQFDPFAHIDRRLHRWYVSDPVEQLAEYGRATWLDLIALSVAEAYNEPSSADLAEERRPRPDTLGWKADQAHRLRDVVGNPFRSVTFAPEWRTDTAVALARGMYESRDFSAMPILADALQDAGCDNDEVLNHCRGEGPHVRGCWVVDLVLGKA